jgi:hypothetical protein
LQAYDFWGILWFSAGVSYLLVLMTESPIVVIEKILFGMYFAPMVVPCHNYVVESSGKKKQSKRNLENGVDNSSLEK